MNISKKFILVVSFFHALVLVGFGHAIAVLGLTIFFAPEFLTNPNIIDLLLIKTDRVPAIGTLSLVGYISFIIACFCKGRNRDVFYVISIIPLWWSIAYLIVRRDSWQMIYSHPVFYLPFLITSLLPFFSRKIGSKVSSLVGNWKKNCNTTQHRQQTGQDNLTSAVVSLSALVWG